MTFTEIADVPTDLESVDTMGFTWSNRDGVWGYTTAARPKEWFQSWTAAAGKSTAYMGPFAEVR